jgi:hypothetical protein
MHVAMRVIRLTRASLYREGTAPYIVERVDITYGIEGDFAPPDIFVSYHTCLPHQFIVTLLVRTIYITHSKTMLGKPLQPFLVGLVLVASILYGRKCSSGSSA